MTRTEIIDGPSDMGLMKSLFRDTKESDYQVTLKVPADLGPDYPAYKSTEHSVSIDQLGRLGNHEWTFKGSSEYFVPGNGTNWAYIEGEFNTQTRKGWLEFREVSLD